MFKTIFIAAALAVFVVGCGLGGESKLDEVRKDDKAMLLKDESTNRFLAVHKTGNLWILYPINEP